MKQLLFPIIITMVITFAFGYFYNYAGEQDQDLVLLVLAAVTGMSVCLFRLKQENKVI